MKFGKFNLMIDLNLNLRFINLHFLNINFHINRISLLHTFIISIKKYLLRSILIKFTFYEIS